MANSHPNITAVIVTYHPDFARLAAMLRALLPQVGAAVIVDNGSVHDMALWARENFAAVHVIALGENKGIAAAQNTGIAWAKEGQSDAALLLDQDSCPAPDMVEKLWAAHKNLQRMGGRVAALGPQIYDENRGGAMTFYKTQGFSQRVQPCSGDETIAVDSIIASGCLIPVAALAAVGEMRADFFIDYVDIEWCLRAQQFGYKIFAVCGAKLFHSLGEKTRQFMERKIPMHNPARYYYMARNRTYMYFHMRLPAGWKILDALRLGRKYIYYSLITPSRLANWRCMTCGIWDGLRGRLGPIPAALSAS